MRYVPLIMKGLFVLAACLTLISSKGVAQSLIPFDFSSEDDNRLIKETDSLKYYVASGDSTNIVCMDEENSFYKLLSRDHKLLAEGAFIVDGDKFLQDGKWVERFITGKLKKEGYYRKNIPIGTWEEFYSNGKLKQVSNYAIFTGEHGDVTSCLSGTYKEFFENGQLKINGFYSAALEKAADTMYVDDPVSGKTVVKYMQHNEYRPEKTSHWEYYTEDGELDKKDDY